MSPLTSAGAAARLPAPAGPTTTEPSTALLAAAPAVSYADRFGYLPITAALAAQTAIPGPVIAASITAYLVAYGACQPAWGALSDRLGRRTVLLIGMIGLAGVDVATTLLIGPAALVASRAAAGAMSGALLPTTLAAVADLVAASRRHRVVSQLVAWASVGGAVAMLGGGLLASHWGWRSPLIALAVAAVLPVPALMLRLPRSQARRGRTSAARELWRVRRAAIRLYAFAFVEGLAMLGTFPLLVPALRARGADAATAGITMATYGVAAVAASVTLPRLQARGERRPVLVGGALLVVGLLTASALPLSPMPLAAAASAALGAAFSLFHSRFQVMAAQLAPAARGTGTGLFVGMVFTGAATGTAATAGLAAAGGYPLAFAVSAAVAVLVTIAGQRLSSSETRRD